MLKKIYLNVLVIACGLGMMGTIVAAAEVPLLRQEEARSECKQCMSINRVNARFCDICGFSFDREAELAPDLIQEIGEQLHESVAKGKNRVVAALLRAYPMLVDVSGKNRVGGFRGAGEVGGSGVIHKMFFEKVLVDPVIETSMFTPLMVAAKHGNAEGARLLLNARARTDVWHENTFRDPLAIALWHNQSDVVRVLLHARRPDIERQLRERNIYNGSTLLMDMIYLDMPLDIVEEALQKGRHLVNEQDKCGGGDTALMQAAHKGNKEAVVLLLAARANVILKSDYSNTAREYAEQQGHSEIAALLEAAEKAGKNGYVVEEAVYV